MLDIAHNNTQRISRCQYDRYSKIAHEFEMDKHARLRRARAAAGFSTAKVAADAMGVNPSTYIHHENGTRDFDNEAAATYARRFGVAVEWLVFGIGGEPPSHVVALPLDGMPVLGEVRAGAWLEIDGEQQPSEFIPAMPDRRFKTSPHFALRVVGTSMNKVVPPGQYVVVVDWASTGMELKDGDLVVVRRERAMTYEVTLKRARIVDGQWQLWPESTDPRHQEPISYGHAERESEIQTAILGLVVGVYQRV